MSVYGGQRQINAAPRGVFRDSVATTEQDYRLGRIPIVGDCVRFEDGRCFRFAEAGGTITKGAILAATPNEADIAATRFGATTAVAPISGEGGSVGDTTIRITDDVTGVTANEYAGGFLNITDGTGEGQQWRIKSNQATGSAGTGWTLELYDGLITALDNTSVGTLINDPYKNVVVHTAANYGGTATQLIVGVAAVAAADTEFLWIQTWGTCLIKAGVATMIKGAPVQPAEDDDGSGQVPVATENRIQIIGTAMEAAADTVWGPVHLTIMP